jgi:hypothetical protein
MTSHDTSYLIVHKVDFLALFRTTFAHVLPAPQFPSNLGGFSFGHLGLHTVVIDPSIHLFQWRRLTKSSSVNNSGLSSILTAVSPGLGPLEEWEGDDGTVKEVTIVMGPVAGPDGGLLAARKHYE